MYFVASKWLDNITYNTKNLNHRFRRSKSFKAKNQREYLRLVLPEDYIPDRAYSYIMNTVLVCVSLCTGMPLLIMILALSLFMAGLVERHKLAAYCKKPPVLNYKYLQLAAWILYLALIFHILFAIAMLGSTIVFLKSTKENAVAKGKIFDGTNFGVCLLIMRNLFLYAINNLNHTNYNTSKINYNYPSVLIFALTIPYS